MHPATPTTPLITALAHLGPHDHLCAIYESQEEQFRIALPFIRIGLERGEQCLYIADHDRVGAVREAMRREGIDVDRATQSQALTVLTPDQTSLTDGSFHLEAMVTVWEDTLAGPGVRGSRPCVPPAKPRGCCEVPPGWSAG